MISRCFAIAARLFAGHETAVVVGHSEVRVILRTSTLTSPYTRAYRSCLGTSTSRCIMSRVIIRLPGGSILRHCYIISVGSDIAPTVVLIAGVRSGACL